MRRIITCIVTIMTALAFCSPAQATETRSEMIGATTAISGVRNTTPSFDWGVFGGHITNSSSATWTYYTRESTGKYHELPNGLLYSVGWSSQPYHKYPVGPGERSSFFHDADMFWVEPNTQGRVRVICDHRRAIGEWKQVYGGDYGVWHKIKPQYCAWEIQLNS